MSNRLMATHLLLDLQTVHHWCKLTENLVGLLVILQLGRNEIGKVAERFGGVENLRRRVSEKPELDGPRRI